MNDLARGISRDRESLAAAFDSVLGSGYVVMGPQHNAFQAALAEYLGVKHVLGVASGTDALEIAIKATMPNGRSTVVTAANAGGYTSVAAKRAGYMVKYADVDADSLCVSLESLKPAITDGVGVVVVTHLYGNLTDITELVSYCHTRGIRVVEDCAQAIGARVNGKTAGSFGDIAATSFYPTKNLGAVGDGGAIFTSSSAFASVVAQLRQYGWSTKYHVEIAAGINSRLDELQAAFLLARLPLLDGFNQRRRDIIELYRKAAEGGPLSVLPATGEHHAGHLAVALTSRRAEIRNELLERGVQTDVHFPVPDYSQPGFAADAVELPITGRASLQIFSLPCFPELSDHEVQQVCSAIGSLK
jgi:aminotransferase EvaB